MSTAVTPTRDPLRAQLHQMWNGVAPAWAAHLGYVDSRGRHVSDRMLELTRPGPGDRVLELACGTGGPGLDAALDEVRRRFGSSAVSRAVLLGRDPGLTVPLLPD